MTNEEIGLRIQQGEHDLMGQLYEQNKGVLHLKAYSLFVRYRDRCASSGVELDDVKQIGYMALCDAVQAYRPEGDYKLLSYLRYPFQNHFRALVGLRTSKRDPLNQCSSLNAPVGEEGDRERLDILVDPESTEPFEAIIEDVFQAEQRITLEKSISKLPNQWASIIRGYYFQGKTLVLVGQELGVSGERVRVLKRNALREMRLDRDLLAFRFADMPLSEMAFHGTGIRSFREHGTSSVERAVMQSMCRRCARF